MSEMVQNRSEGLRHLHFKGIVVNRLGILKVNGCADRACMGRFRNLRERELYVACLQLLAVVEFHALSQVEYIGSVIYNVPGFRKPRCNISVVITCYKCLKNTAGHTDRRCVCCSVGIQRYRIRTLCNCESILCSTLGA